MVPVLVGMSRRCFVGLITRARCSVRCCAVIVLGVGLSLIFTRAHCSVRCYAVIMLGVGLRPTVRNSLPYICLCVFYHPDISTHNLPVLSSAPFFALLARTSCVLVQPRVQHCDGG